MRLTPEEARVCRRAIEIARSPLPEDYDPNDAIILGSLLLPRLQDEEADFDTAAGTLKDHRILLDGLDMAIARLQALRERVARSE